MKQFAEAMTVAGGIACRLAPLAAGRRGPADPGNPYYQQKNVARAKETLRKLVEGFPESKVLDRAHFRLGEYAAAAADARPPPPSTAPVVEKWPASSLAPYVLAGLGWALFDQKDFAAAEQSFNSLVEKYPEQRAKFRSLYARGLARHHLGKFDQATADLAGFS